MKTTRPFFHRTGSTVPLLSTIECFLEVHDIAPTRFSRLATRDPRFVFDLRQGREPRPALTQRVEHFMNTYTADLPQETRR